MMSGGVLYASMLDPSVGLPINILLVEDNPGDADLVREYLAECRGLSNYDLKRVERLDSGVQHLNEGRVDVVLLDLDLPDVKGMAAVSRVVSAHPSVPVVVLTGHPELGEKAIAQGAQDYLSKELLDTDRLSRSLRYAIARARMGQRLHVAVQHNADAMVVIGSADGLIKFANRAAARLFDTTAAALVGQHFGFPLGSQSAAEIELVWGGSPRSAEMRVAEIEWEGDGAFLASIRDITDRKRAEELQRRLIHADRLAAIGQLAAGVAHEVNNPAQYMLANFRQLEEAVADLSAMVADVRGRVLGAEDGLPPVPMSELLSSRDIDLLLDDMRNIARDNRGGIERIVEIVKDLRSFSRSDREHLELVDVNEAIRVACKMTRNEVRHRAELVADLGPLPPIVADRGKLCQVFTNLLMNAAQSIEEGAATRNQIRITSVVDRNCIRVSIEDTGCGIPEYLHDKVFEPFFTTKPREVGTGLGLPLTADLIRQHGGEIELNSAQGHGTRFDIVLPIESSLQLTEVSAPERRPTSSPRRARVLVIDDDIQLLHAFERMLRRHHDVRVVRGGSEALRCFEETTAFDVIICDLMMPEVDGKQVYEHVARHAPDLVRRIVFCSGGVFTERLRKFLATAGNICLEKPVDTDLLLNIVEQLAGSPGATDST